MTFKFDEGCDAGGYITYLGYQDYDGTTKYVPHTTPDCTNPVTHRYKGVGHDLNPNYRWSNRCADHVKILDSRCLIEKL